MANNDVKIKFDDKNLNDILRMLKKDYRVRIGILGNKATARHDSKSGLTNVETGTFHEFGTSKMPQRSFLWMPLKEKLRDEIKDMKKVVFKQLYVKKAPDEFFKTLMSKALDIVEEAFNTNGYGQWKSLTAATKRRKERLNLSPNTLVETGKLRNSITGKIIKK